MSDQITTAFHQKFAAGIGLLAQQMKAVTDGTTRTEGMDGERAFFDQIGVVKMQDKVGRAVDIPVVNTPHSRRSVTAIDKYMRDFIDSFDKLKILNDPTNAYSEVFVAAGKRAKDKIALDAGFGTSFTGKTGATAVPLPAGQIIAAGGTGFTFPKLRQAVTKLKGSNILMPGDVIHCFWTAKQEEEFINTTEVKSSDFNRTKVLVNGELEFFYGTNFRRIEDVSPTERMLPFSGGVRSTILWVKRAMLLGTWKDIHGKLAWIDERDAWQVMAGMSMGATRMQEVGVVQIDVDEV